MVKVPCKFSALQIPLICCLAWGHIFGRDEIHHFFLLWGAEEMVLEVYQLNVGSISELFWLQCHVFSSDVLKVLSQSHYLSKSIMLPECRFLLYCLNRSGKDHIMNFAKMSDSKKSIWAVRPISVFKFLP